MQVEFYRYRRYTRGCQEETSIAFVPAKIQSQTFTKSVVTSSKSHDPSSGACTKYPVRSRGYSGKRISRPESKNHTC